MNKNEFTNGGFFSHEELRYVDYMNTFSRLSEKGKMVNLSMLYEEFGKPLNRGPKKVLSSDILLDCISAIHRERSTKYKEVINFKGDDVYVHGAVAVIYLTILDSKTAMNRGFWEKLEDVNGNGNSPLSIDEFLDETEWILKEYFGANYRKGI